MRPPRSLAGPVVALLVVLAGCGGDDGPAPDDVVTTVTTTTVVTETVAGASTPAPPSAAGSTSAAGIDLAQPPTSYDEAVAHVAAGHDVGELATFQTPTGNIYCALLDDVIPVGCEIGEGAIEDPDVCTAPEISRFVDRLDLVDGSASAECATDTIRLPDPPVLAYGDTVTTRDTQCVSEEIGVTCVARNARGAFFLARGRYELINP